MRVSGAGFVWSILSGDSADFSRHALFLASDQNASLRRRAEVRRQLYCFCLRVHPISLLELNRPLEIQIRWR